MVAAKKNQKIASGIGRVARTVYRPLTRVAPLKGVSGRNTFAPIPGEAPIVLLRVHVMCCEELLAKDRNGSSDPFVVVSVLGTRAQTPVVKRSTNPVWSAKEATFDIPIYLSLADRLGALELVVWDKDMLRKDYLGECALPLEDWFKPPVFAFDDPENEPITAPLVSTRASTSARGYIRVKVGFVQPPNVVNLADFSETYEGLIKRARPSLVSAPPTEGIGTIRLHNVGPEYEDDGLTSDEGEPEDSSDNEDDDVPTPNIQPRKPPSSQAEAPPFLSLAPIQAPTPESPTPMPKSNPPSKPPSPGFKVLPKLLRRPTSNATDAPVPLTPPPMGDRTTSSASVATTASAAPGKKKRIRSWAPKPGEYDFNASKDVVGIVMLEVKNAEDLPKLKNMTRTGWDMDPFVVISFGKKVFRTRVIRHSLNPVWDEKLLFHVRRYEKTFRVQLAVLDWDKISSNDPIGQASFDLSQLLANVPEKDPETGLYPHEEDGNRSFVELALPLQSTSPTSLWESKHSPKITVRAKYQPYDALRQRFWYQFIKQYDTDDTGRLSHLELTSMLDSLGSTLSAETISSFWTRYGKSIQAEDELTYAEAIRALEAEITRPIAEKKRIDPRENEKAGLSLGSSTPSTPNPLAQHEHPALNRLEGLSFAGPGLNIPDEHAQKSNAKPDVVTSYSTDGMQATLDIPPATLGAAEPLPSPSPSPSPSPGPASASSAGPASTSSTPPTSNATTPNLSQAALGGGGGGSSTSDADESGGSSPSSEASFERVINVKNCPLCHRPRMSAKAERDIVTHLAVCASGDWTRVDRMLVGNFVTASQAQRKWYTRMFRKPLSGDYKLGANSANIIVQNRMTGQLEEEKMQVYVRLGIRLLYKGARSRLEGARARRLLKSMSIKQGVKYDSPASVVDIRPFIEFHNLDITEIERPLDEYKTFNDFFYRKLKPDARPVECAPDPNRIVSAADCRLMAFESVSEATRLWIKGREFTVGRLLGPAYKDEAERYAGGALVIFRLAPQDYHRFHSPVDGTIGSMTYISGEYYTVNPQAIRTTLDVYGENARKIVPIDSPQFGRVMAVCIGAMMVGSIKTTVNEGESVKRGQEFGYFAFGGSTIVMLFEPGVVEWDEDLLINGRAALETLVRVGMGIGRRTGTQPTAAA